MPRLLKIGLAAMMLLATVVAANAAPPKLPYGPEGKGRFGAYYTTLKYIPDWDAQWRVGSKADVVVRFDQYDYRLVFWRGTNYVPFWVNEKRAWYSNGCVEREDASPKWDKLCRYSFASVIESNDARVVVRWRYALLDKDGKLVNTDPMTNWNDWVDEYYTIYPDALGIRKMTLYSSVLAEPVSRQQCTVVTNPGGKPSGRVVREKVLGHVDLEGADPFYAMYSKYSFKSDSSTAFSDWPVSGIAGPASDRPGCGILGRVSEWEGRRRDKDSFTWLMMTGFTDSRSVDQKALWSWLLAPKIASTGCTYSGYDEGERAYQLSCAAPTALKLKLNASAGSPLYNPAFVIKAWGRTDISLSIDGKPIPRGPDFRYGFRKTDTVSDLIIWVKKQSTKPVTFEIKPVGGGK